MGNQSRISDEVKTKVLLESGFRCAIDGRPCSTRTAQFTPWHQAKQYNAEDLICLCKECHERAINHEWSDEDLREVKRQPWVVRQPEDALAKTAPTTLVRLVIEGHEEEFQQNEQRWVQYAIAAFLDVLPNAVQIKKVTNGSVHVTIELPKKSVRTLLSAHQRRDPELAEYLAPVVLSDLHHVFSIRERAINASQAGGRSAAKTWRWILRNGFGFYGRLWLKQTVIAVLIAAAILSLHSAITNCEMPLSARSAMVIAALFFLFLLADTIRFLFDLFFSSPNETLRLARRIDPEIDEALNDVEARVKTLKGEEQKNEIRSQARELCSDFLSRPPYPRITFRFACHGILNFLLTMLCFVIFTLAMARLDVYCGASLPTYGHDCFIDSSFFETLIHFCYYHSVIFQSLGDGGHGPTTFFAQAVATTETLTSFFYIFLIFGGIYNAGAAARDNLTPRLIRTSIEKYLIALCSNNNPVIKQKPCETKR